MGHLGRGEGEYAGVDDPKLPRPWPPATQVDRLGGRSLGQLGKEWEGKLYFRLPPPFHAGEVRFPSALSALCDRINRSAVRIRLRLPQRYPEGR